MTDPLPIDTEVPEVAEKILDQLLRLTVAVDNLTAITLAVGLRAYDVSKESAERDIIEALEILRSRIEQ